MKLKRTNILYEGNGKAHHFQKECRYQQTAAKWGSLVTMGGLEPITFNSKRREPIRLIAAA